MDEQYYGNVNAWLNLNGNESESDDTIRTLAAAGRVPSPGSEILTRARTVYDHLVDPNDPRAPHEQIIQAHPDTVRKAYQAFFPNLTEYQDDPQIDVGNVADIRAAWIQWITRASDDQIVVFHFNALNILEEKYDDPPTLEFNPNTITPSA